MTPNSYEELEARLRKRGGIDTVHADALADLRKQRDEAQALERDAHEAENEAKDCFWAIYPEYVRLTGKGISTEAARTALAERATVAEAEYDRLRKLAEALRDACILYYPGERGPDPDSWQCELCGEAWETCQHEPDAHAQNCAVRASYAALPPPSLSPEPEEP